MAYDPYDYKVNPVEPSFSFSDYDKPTGQEDAMENLRKAGRLNILSQGLQSLTEGVGVAMGAPIRRREDKFGVSALDKFLQAQAKNDQLEAEYDKLDLNKDITEKKMKLDADLQNARLATQAIFERERQRGMDMRGVLDRKSRENQEAIRQKGYLDREKEQQAGLTARKKAEIEAETAKTGMSDLEFADLWEQYPEIASNFFTEDFDEMGNPVPKQIGDLDKNEQTMGKAIAAHISNPWNQVVDAEPDQDGYKFVNRATGKSVIPETSIDGFPEGSIDSSRSTVFYGPENQQYKTFADKRTGIKYGVSNDGGLILIKPNGRGIKLN